MFLTQLGQQIMSELRHGPINPYALADAIDQPPFAVRGELQHLRRLALVREHIGREHTWELTDRGTEYAWGELQLELDVRQIRVPRRVYG
jgi:hypothetical protein